MAATRRRGAARLGFAQLVCFLLPGHCHLLPQSPVLEDLYFFKKDSLITVTDGGGAILGTCVQFPLYPETWLGFYGTD